ncbi:hypothetical protein ES707_13496 [subsurface metagenome]
MFLDVLKLVNLIGLNLEFYYTFIQKLQKEFELGYQSFVIQKEITDIKT